MCVCRCSDDDDGRWAATPPPQPPQRRRRRRDVVKIAFYVCITPLEQRQRRTHARNQSINTLITRMRCIIKITTLFASVGQCMEARRKMGQSARTPARTNARTHARGTLAADRRARDRSSAAELVYGAHALGCIPVPL